MGSSFPSGSPGQSIRRTLQFLSERDAAELWRTHVLSLAKILLPGELQHRTPAGDGREH